MSGNGQMQSQGLGGLAYVATAAFVAADVGKGVIADASNDCAVVVATANTKIIGVVTEPVPAGAVGRFQSVRGTSTIVQMSGVCAPGDKLQITTGGVFLKAASSAQRIAAVAMETATATGDLIEAILVDDYVA